MSIDNLASVEKMVDEAKKIQNKMTNLQEELGQLQIIGSAGAGAVKVKINGGYEALEMYIADNLMSGKKEMIEQLSVAAFNDAVQKLGRVSKDKIAQLTSSIKLPNELMEAMGGEGKA